MGQPSVERLDTSKLAEFFSRMDAVGAQEIHVDEGTSASDAKDEIMEFVCRVKITAPQKSFLDNIVCDIEKGPCRRIAVVVEAGTLRFFKFY